MTKWKEYCLLAVLLTRIIFCFSQETKVLNSFIRRNDTGFRLSGEPYYFIGTNYWYGPLLGNNKVDKIRLTEELSFLKAKGIFNLRILAGAEGSGNDNGMPRVSPPLQSGEGLFNKKVLQGLDFLLNEMSKRNMHAVIYLSNNWEWSGGFLQYVNWSGEISRQKMNSRMTWDEQRYYVSKFYDCESCIRDYKKQVEVILNRRNIYNNRIYKNDPTIMAWELANEPRPMLQSSFNSFCRWIKNMSQYIRYIDRNHLITIGSEGMAGTNDDISLYKKINAYKNIDYLTIHIWPKNWGYFQDTSIAKSWTNIINNSAKYIDEHTRIAEELHKPLVIEEFGLPRDKVSYDPQAKTNLRDEYYKFIFEESRKKGIAGCNFWAFGGLGRPDKGQVFWKAGDAWIGDPPNEEQGLNSVYNSDTSTWKVIESFMRP